MADAAIAAAAALTGLGIALYLVDMECLYLARRRHKLELNTLMVAPAHVRWRSWLMTIPRAANHGRGNFAPGSRRPDSRKL